MSDIVHHILCARNGLSGTVCHFFVANIVFQIAYIRYCVQDIVNRILCSRNYVPDIVCQILCVRCYVPDIVHAKYFFARCVELGVMCR